MRRRKFRRYSETDTSKLAVAFGSGLLAAMFFSPKFALLLATVALICVAGKSRR